MVYKAPKSKLSFAIFFSFFSCDEKDGESTFSSRIFYPEIKKCILHLDFFNLLKIKFRYAFK